MQMKNKMLTLVGNRPQFIKMAPISKEIQKRGYKEIIVHSGQHYDKELNEIFFEELNLNKPDFFLKMQGTSHGQMTGNFLIQMEKLLEDLSPQSILLYGDTNTTLAGALAAIKLHIPIAHIEAGPRIYDMKTPEEINRLVTDHAAELKFCCDISSVQNLAKENIIKNVFYTGDVMLDAFNYFSQYIHTDFLKKYNLKSDAYVLMTSHRPNNTDSKESLENLINLIQHINMDVAFPLHPRTRKNLTKYNLLEKFHAIKNLSVLPSLGYIDILSLLNFCHSVITDSGGLQKEAFYAKKLCYILFHSTPWPEIHATKWQKILGCIDNVNFEIVNKNLKMNAKPSSHPSIFGIGKAATKIVNILEQKEFLN